ncbi:sugar phosphate isomerase/epimerase family protein [Saccharopolyspora spinosporotrichia]
MSHPSRPLGVGHLTALGLAPPALVTTAAEAGFDSVGLRVLTGNGTERRWPVDVGSPMLLETVRRLEDTGVSVLDVEIVALKPGTAPADYEQALEVGVRLGARFLNVMCDDPDLDRASDTFAGVVERARIYGIRPAIEPMAYKRVSSLSQAAGIARRSDGGGVLLDSLHLRRCGETLDDVRALDPDLLTYVQISDAPRRLRVWIALRNRCHASRCAATTPPRWRASPRGCPPGTASWVCANCSMSCHRTSPSASRRRTSS